MLRDDHAPEHRPLEVQYVWRSREQPRSLKLGHFIVPWSRFGIVQLCNELELCTSSANPD
jgi:hypothetical protein